MPFVELPLNASEDRLAGALHLEKTLRSGRRKLRFLLLDWWHFCRRYAR
jgi:Mg-chelatase subunit ChlI